MVLWMCEAELGGPFNQDGDVVPDGAVVEQFVLFGNDFLYGRPLFIGETFGQAVHDFHEGPGFRFFGHSQSFGPGTPDSQQAHFIPLRFDPGAARLAL